ncbi:MULTISPECIES: purine-nucleoside phosphorylase [unclassified Rathayibacter]|uniref:purine-nucleoside phosphorylase n=1 Tax=unclassified Rathayibacter TaxID=2609250 RepID=UPI000F4C750B|nr:MULTISPECIES: purine-nucleoside phosphorylase [unclassified Rathayibacter]MCJ1672719.1 purine-nucleoside phosphorylase [Rathayibacter sp. VKM Ac-2929]MCJ1682198.1 purine-nucleoside phosphorylase [Rathayibacter sp. VKM Ac-2928]MCJ1685859.1 purine-nucleoside phosphorylase [Rathayibacter sp. VKM Ac-2927]ROP57532.1 purine-nucleoside phosphorylase [Rathayibacter sp. PhB186]ROS55917.1 purine-nucleoside phosphorylase [Rathayibacter sp. PhB185]
MADQTPNPLDSADADPFAIAAEAAAQIIEATGVEKHDIALTLGSGWGKAADAIGETTAVVPATDIVGFTKSAVHGHGGSLRSVLLPTGKRALIIGARTHYYEGYGVRRVAHSVRVAAATGASVMILTNGAGGIKEHWTPGTPVLISDHINLTADSPLEGATFVDLTDLYSARLRALARETRADLDDGVYVQFRGPHYESPAEVQMARIIGGHIVGMSTALEAIAAREAGMEVLGMSLITNLAAGIQKTPLSHEEVLEAGRNAEDDLARLLAGITGAL